MVFGIFLGLLFIGGVIEQAIDCVHGVAAPTVGRPFQKVVGMHCEICFSLYIF